MYQNNGTSYGHQQTDLIMLFSDGKIEQTVKGTLREKVIVACPLQPLNASNHVVLSEKRWYKQNPTGRFDLIAASNTVATGRNSENLDNNGSLVIKSVTRNDSGVYKCQFTGYPNYTVRLQLQGKYAANTVESCYDTLRARQNNRHFADGLFKCVFLSENFQFSLNFNEVYSFVCVQLTKWFIQWFR